MLSKAEIYRSCSNHLLHLDNFLSFFSFLSQGPCLHTLRRGRRKTSGFKKTMTNKKILVYTFYNRWHISYKIVSVLGGNIHKIYLGNLKSLASHIIKEKYDYILGLGDSRRGGKKIRIEEIYKNEYGRREIIIGGKASYKSSWKLELNNNTIHSQNAYNGPCNRSAYFLLSEIEKNNLSTKLAFVHIPKDFIFSEAKERIEYLIQFSS
jgi:hypothetical protein